jgi:hypothetical protein
MKPDDKFPEEMLDDIEGYAQSAVEALCELAYSIDRLSYTYPTFNVEKIAAWKRMVASALYDARDIIFDSDELADAEDETAEGGEE